MFLFLYCKDTTKSNNRQIFKGKSYYIAYYLTFINNKIKDYYIITYFLLLFMLLYVVSLYYIYTLLYIKKEQMNQSRERANERTEQEERTRAKDSAVIFASSSPLFCSVCCLHRPHHLQPLNPHHVAPSPNGMAATSSASGRCHRHTSPPHRQRTAASSDRAAPRRSAILPASSSSSSTSLSSFRW